MGRDCRIGSLCRSGDDSKTLHQLAVMRKAIEKGAAVLGSSSFLLPRIYVPKDELNTW